VGFKSEKWLQEPHNCYTIIRANFDKWFSKKAEEAGAQLFTGVTVREGIKKDGKVVGVKTSEGDELLRGCGDRRRRRQLPFGPKPGPVGRVESDEVALGVKEVLALPREKLEDRFNLERGEGTTIEMFGDNTQGMLGYTFFVHEQGIHLLRHRGETLPFPENRHPARRIFWSTPRTTPWSSVC
jgi:electron transfer flavoprotein-quinone oxidoreductase